MKRSLKALLYYTLLVILWGAWVRISHSGNGCGEHWPLCQGEVIPIGANQKTWIELSHRMMSGFFGIFVFALFIRSLFLYEKNHNVRKWIGWSLFFTVTEALLGARLVLAGLVGDNNSWGRALTMSLHMLNSLFLVGSIAMAHFSVDRPNAKINFKKWLGFFAGIAITGAIASLAVTLFPSTSLLEGLNKDLSSDSPWILRLRVLHPFLALLFSGHASGWFYKRNKRLSALFAIQVLVGLMTLFLLSPLPLKIFHLFLVHWIWIHLVRWCASDE